MTKGVTIAAVVANLVVAFYAGRRSFGSLREYAHADVVAVYDVCDEGKFVGGCKGCSDCEAWEYAAGGCTYFKDTFCTLCEEIKNCPQMNIRCENKNDHRCLECDKGFWDEDCKPCLVCESGNYESEKCTQTSNTVCERCSDCPQDHFTFQRCDYFSDTVCHQCTHCSPQNVDDPETGECGKDLKTGKCNEGFTPAMAKCDIDLGILDIDGKEGKRGLPFPRSVYTNGLDTVCTKCTRPFNDGFLPDDAGIFPIPPTSTENSEVAEAVALTSMVQIDGREEKMGYKMIDFDGSDETTSDRQEVVWSYHQFDERVTAQCTEYVDTEVVQCTMCPCKNRPTCEYMREYCTPGDFKSTPGDKIICEECTKIRGGATMQADGVTEKSEFVSGVEWEVFRCGGTSDALFRDCQICMDGEYEAKPCTQTSDALCPACNLNLAYGYLQYCKNTHYTCSNFQDTTCDECQEGWFGETCCYHRYYGSCGTMSTRERIPRRLGYEGITNEAFIDFCQMLCDEFPDCLAFEIEDGGTSLLGGGMNSFEGKMAKCYFKSAFSQDETATSAEVDENGVAKSMKGVSNAARAFKGINHEYRGTDPSYDCYSNVCRQNAAFPNAYQTDIVVEDDFDSKVMATDVEGTAYQAGAMTRRLTRGYAGGSSAASRSEYKRMLEKEGANPGK